MSKLRKYYASDLCISFTLTVVSAAIWNIIEGNDPTGFMTFILQLGVFLSVIISIDYLIERLYFKNWFLQIGLVFLINYSIYMGCAFFLHWYGFRIVNIFIATLIFIVIFSVVVIRNIRLYKQEEKWINRMLEKRNSDVAQK
jgi:fatty acid desaturase